MMDDFTTAIPAWLTSSRLLGVGLLAGLFALSLAFVILILTRWGQVRPLSKCAALSVLAHVLLMGMAYSTKLLVEPPPAAVGDTLQVSFADSADDAESSSDAASAEAESWNQFNSHTPVTPKVSVPQRQIVAASRPEASRTPGGPPPIDAAPHEPPAVTKESRDRPPSPAPVAVTDRHRPAPPAAGIDAPAPQRTEVQPAGPAAAAPVRRNPTPDAGADPKPPAAPSVPAELLHVASQVHRLSDPAMMDAADAVSDSQDAPREALNDPAEGMTGGAENPATSGAPAAGAQTDNPPTVREIAAAAPSRRLGDGGELPPVYRARFSRSRLQLALQFGGDAGTEEAVAMALAWLAARQDKDGRFRATEHGSGREDRVLGHDRGGAGAQADTGVTALAVLAFMAAGNTHLEGEYRENVQHGLEFLLRSQGEDGDLAGEARLYARMYCHGMASLALSEALAVTGDRRLLPFVNRAVEFSVNAQHAGSGGWRYQAGDRGDMSQFGWQVMALRSAALAGIEVPPRTETGMRRFLRGASSGEEGGLASYRPGERVSAPMTAEALACRYFLNAEREPATVGEAVTFIRLHPPGDGQANLYYWYYSTVALFQHQGDDWKDWNAALKPQLLRRQTKTGDDAGSWPADTMWGGYGGRIYTTALAALCLEVYYRYLPVLGDEP